MLSSGTTAKSTTNDNAVDLFTNPGNVVCRRVTFINEGLVKGFVSVDGGNTWLYMPAAVLASDGTTVLPASRTIDLTDNRKVMAQAKRVAGGSNMTGLYADAF